jgi:uncharacterized protein with HEPN domain
MPRSSVTPYLTDMVEAIERVRDKAGDTPLEVFKVDWEKQWIVERGIEIVSGQSGLPDELKARHPDIPWQKVAAIGNVLRHEYRQISAPLMWEVVRDYLPPLEKVCREELVREH